MQTDWIAQSRDQVAAHKAWMAGNSTQPTVRGDRACAARASPPGNSDRCSGPADRPSRFPAFEFPRNFSLQVLFRGLRRAAGIGPPSLWRIRQQAIGGEWNGETSWLFGAV